MKLGDVELVRIGLGTNRLTNTAHNVAFIRAAVAAGVQMIDTAHSYTGGQSEETIGEASPRPRATSSSPPRAASAARARVSRRCCAPRSSRASAGSRPTRSRSTTFTASTL